MKKVPTIPPHTKKMNSSNSAAVFPVNEIFASVNGEGTLSGELAVFVRLCGCNLRCTYCDTSYAWDFDDRRNMTAGEILEKVRSFGSIRNITLTGGEPLFRRNAEELLEVLTAAGYLVNIETNGSVNLGRYLELPCASRLIFCCDYKLPSSGEEEKMDTDNPGLLRPNDVLKFVIGSEEDFNRTLEVITKFRPQCFIYLSAVFGRVEPKEIVAKLLSWTEKTDTSKIRVQLQMHKYIWDPNLRGV